MNSPLHHIYSGQYEGIVFGDLQYVRRRNLRVERRVDVFDEFICTPELVVPEFMDGESPFASGGISDGRTRMRASYLCPGAETTTLSVENPARRRAFSRGVKPSNRLRSPHRPRASILDFS